MTANEAVFTLNGLKTIKGLDFFDCVMPTSRINLLFQACLETKGFQWVEQSFCLWVVKIASREIRAGLKKCKYRLPYELLSRQKNALRIEIFSPQDRCGMKLKHDRVGGRSDDYYPCNFN